MLKNILFVGLGGAIGSILRYAISCITSHFQHLPALFGTLLANILGCFAIGIVLSSCDRESLLLFASVGICGGFTTFSTFSAQTIDALQSGKYALAIGYILTTLLICLLMTWAGLSVGKKIL